MMVSVELSPCGKASRSRGMCIKPMMGEKMEGSQEGKVGIELRDYIDMRRCDPVSGGIVRGEVRVGNVEARMRSNSPGWCIKGTMRYTERRGRKKLFNLSADSPDMYASAVPRIGAYSQSRDTF